MRRSPTSTESTFGTGANTERETARSTCTSQASCASTDGTPYAPLPGAAAKRSPTSFWTMPTHSPTCSSSSIVRRIAPAAMPYGRLATTFVGAGRQRGEVEAHGVGDVQRDVVKRVDRLAQRRLEAAVELDDVDMRGERRQVLGEHAEATADLQDDIALAELARRAR